MWTKRVRFGFGSLLTAFVMVGSLSGGAQAGPVAYDGFEGGPAEDLHGYSGGQGWSGPWFDIGSGIFTQVSEPSGGLTFGELAVMPGCAITPAGWLPDMTTYQRAFPAIVGDTMYVSFLIRPEPDYSNWYTLRLGTWPRQVDVGLPIGYYNFGLMVGDGLIDVAPTEAVPGVTNLLVLEVAHHQSGNSTTYKLFIDPVPGDAQPAFGDVEMSRPGLISFGNWIQLLGEGGYSIDEIRIGETWESVTPPAGIQCPADLNSDGVLDFFDALAFLGAFAAGDSVADWNQDGVFDFFDAQQYLSDFSAGCP